ncbi:uncharacterized protein LOC112094309 isoform X2 [Morus notabilis]|uniref:uncharacterized protein LOC112094309 isoform X2 n=1 Tax=Morus notabilis TaxID=981085 RepID=UPI000CED01F1|nr:uncharacterized protein LOC112094309 isoform X2 [Morus notabilis]
MVVGFIPSCLSLLQQPRPSICISKHISSRKYKREITRTAGIRRTLISPPPLKDTFGIRVFVVSDLHTEYAENMKWVECLSTVRYKNDVLLVAGDVAETYSNFILTMSMLKDRFEHVFYVPGNHDLWCRRDGESYSFDKEEDITGIHIPSLEMACKDFHACKWPGELSSGDASLALYFDAMNERNQNVVDKIQRICSQIVTFSHFVPRQELCPEKRMLFYPKLPKIIGSDCLEHRIRSIHGTEGDESACHVFGHTHFCWDAVIDGIRYVQAPLAYPRERKRRMNGGENWLPFCIYSEGKFSERISPCFWSDYYSVNPRTPHNTELAPWVARFYHRT